MSRISTQTLKCPDKLWYIFCYPLDVVFFSKSTCLHLMLKCTLLDCIKGQLQRFYKLVSYERAVKILKNDICITDIGQAVLEIFEFKVKFPRKIPKIGNFANVTITKVEQ